MLACCGLICTECNIYQAANDPQAAEELAQRWRDAGTAAARADWFTCQGCHGDDAKVWSGNCQIRACCKEKGMQSCHPCADFPCVHITAFENDRHPHHRAAVAHLRRLREG